MFGIKKKRRARLMKTPLPAEWLAFIRRNVPYYRILPADYRRELEGLIGAFLDEKHFEGCDGIEINDEIRLTIAAQACILLLHRKTDIYPLLQSILVYPHPYVAPVKWREPGGIVAEEVEERDGESWPDGALVLAWDEVLADARDIHDGFNVVFHEFAHQLDDESGRGDGAPLLPKGSMYADWERVMRKEYEALADDAAEARPTLLDQYGAESPAEFFAVATECFFEMPVELKARHRELYEQLMLFYEQDPASFARTAEGNRSEANW